MCTAIALTFKIQCKSILLYLSVFLQKISLQTGRITYNSLIWTFFLCLFVLVRTSDADWCRNGEGINLDVCLIIWDLLSSFITKKGNILKQVCIYIIFWGKIKLLFLRIWDTGVLDLMQCFSVSIETFTCFSFSNFYVANFIH